VIEGLQVRQSCIAWKFMLKGDSKEGRRGAGRCEKCWSSLCWTYLNLPPCLQVWWSIALLWFMCALPAVLIYEVQYYLLSCVIQHASELWASHLARTAHTNIRDYTTAPKTAAAAVAAADAAEDSLLVVVVPAAAAVVHQEALQHAHRKEAAAAAPVHHHTFLDIAAAAVAAAVAGRKVTAAAAVAAASVVVTAAAAAAVWNHILGHT
jgi:hypothetical protein